MQPNRFLLLVIFIPLILVACSAPHENSGKPVKDDLFGDLQAGPNALPSGTPLK